MQFLNNYKKQPFIPAIQKTSTLVILSVIALVGFIISINSTTVDISPSYDLKIKAARLMEKSMSALKNNRMESGVFIDDENDPNETGLVGGPFSLITTDEGDLDAKLTTLDPNFSAGMVELMLKMKLQEGDTVAILGTGPIGLFHLIKANLMGAGKLISIDPSNYRTSIAEEFGATNIINSNKLVIYR